MVSELFHTSITRILPEETTEYAAGGSVMTSCLEFMGILLVFFFAVGIVLIGVMIYRTRKLRRLTNPVKEHTYKR